MLEEVDLSGSGCLVKLAWQAGERMGDGRAVGVLDEGGRRLSVAPFGGGQEQRMVSLPACVILSQAS